MHLIIDIGNTQTKIALFEQNSFISHQFVETPELKTQLEQILVNHSITASILSSVVGSLPEIELLLASKTKSFIFNHKTPIPITNKYLTPKTLGLDRLANAIALSKQFPRQNAMSIDIGTCIKFDFVSQKGHYLGGSISLGLLMRYQALSFYTAKLPELNPIENPLLIGTNTQKSIHSGVLLGMQSEIEGIISRYSVQYSELKVVLTGGDHNYFAEAFKNSIFARPNLTLEGLNEVLLFNE